MQTPPLAKLIRHLTIFVLVTGLFGLVAKSQETQQAKQDKPTVSLQIAAVLAKSGPTVIFIATNNSGKELFLDPASVNGSPVVIVRPDDKVVMHVAAVSRVGPPPTIKPHQTLTWSKDLYDVFNSDKLNESGLYRVFWEATTSELNIPHNAVYKSNELLIMREKGTPAIDPTTGMRFDPETGQFIDPTTGKPYKQ